MNTTQSARIRLPNALARRLFLHHHCLTVTNPGLTPTQDLQALIERLGFVQVDAINTVERAHHMILSARRKPYRPRHLKTLLERERSLFEGWTHDASVIPVQFYPYWRLRFQRDAQRLPSAWREWQGSDFTHQMDQVLDQIARDGPTMARDVGEGETRQEGMMLWRPSKTALEFLWRTGRLAVTRREGFQKVFDLSERVIPAEHLNTRVEDEGIVDWACHTALDRLGFGTAGEIARFWDLISPAEAKAWVARQKDLIEIDVEDAQGSWRAAWARPGVLEAAQTAPEPPGRVRVLSPFDPALRDRTRAERLFGFRYRIEIFVPAAQRVYGYYVFPVLEGSRLIGRIDMKRTEGVLDVTSFWPERGVKMGSGRLSRLEAELHRAGKFGGCGSVRFGNGWFCEDHPVPPER